MNKMVSGYEGEDGLHVYCPRRALRKLSQDFLKPPHTFCLTPHQLLQICPECEYEPCPVRKIVERVQKEEENGE